MTFECDEPPAARRDKTVVVGGRGHVGNGSRRDRRATCASGWRPGEDLYTLHRGALAELRPDLILTQDLCRVCAIPSGQVQSALDHLGC